MNALLGSASPFFLPQSLRCLSILPSLPLFHVVSGSDRLQLEPAHLLLLLVLFSVKLCQWYWPPLRPEPPDALA